MRIIYNIYKIRPAAKVMLDMPCRRLVFQTATILVALTLLQSIAPGDRAIAAEPLLDANDLAVLHAYLQAAPQGVVVIGRLGPDGRRTIAVVSASAATPHASADSIFEIGSITKTFTALVLADMIRRDEVALSDPIQKYLPPATIAPTYETREITLLDLADHHSGLSRMPPDVAFGPQAIADYGAPQLYASLTSFTLTRAPGAAYEYSNWGGGLLGQLLANRADASYAQLVQERVCDPLGLHATYVPPPHAPAGALLAGFDADGNPQPDLTWGALAGAGAIRSTVNDLLTYGAACLPKSTGGIAQDCQMAMEPRADSGPALKDSRVGLIWETDSDGIVWHNGDTFGYHAFLGIDPQHNTVVAMLTNVSPFTDKIGFHLLDPKRTATGPVASVPVPDRVLDRYVGKYLVADGSKDVLNVSRGNRGLMLTMPNSTHYELVALSSDTFTTRENASISFATRPDGTAYALIRKGYEGTLVATKMGLVGFEPTRNQL